MTVLVTRPAQSNKKPRLLIYGGKKRGKTLFSATAGQGKIVLLDPEFGTAWMKSPKLNPHVVHITEWGEITEFITFLRSGNHNYEWVGIDGLTRLLRMALMFVLHRPVDTPLNKALDPISLPKRGQANDLLISLFHKLDRLPLGVIYTAQERILSERKEVEGDPVFSDSLTEEIEEAANGHSREVIVTTLRYVPDLTDEVRKAITQLVDVIGRLYVVRSPETGKLERRLWVAPHDAYDTGYRSCYTLPDSISRPTTPKLINLLERGKAV